MVQDQESDVLWRTHCMKMTALECWQDLAPWNQMMKLKHELLRSFVYCDKCQHWVAYKRGQKNFNYSQLRTVMLIRLKILLIKNSFDTSVRFRKCMLLILWKANILVYLKLQLMIGSLQVTRVKCMYKTQQKSTTVLGTTSIHNLNSQAHIKADK